MRFPRIEVRRIDVSTFMIITITILKHTYLRSPEGLGAAGENSPIADSADDEQYGVGNGEAQLQRRPGRQHRHIVRRVIEDRGVFHRSENRIAKRYRWTVIVREGIRSNSKFRPHTNACLGSTQNLFKKRFFLSRPLRVVRREFVLTERWRFIQCSRGRNIMRIGVALSNSRL